MSIVQFLWGRRTFFYIETRNFFNRLTLSKDFAFWQPTNEDILCHLQTKEGVVK